MTIWDVLAIIYLQRRLCYTRLAELRACTVGRCGCVRYFLDGKGVVLQAALLVGVLLCTSCTTSPKVPSNVENPMPTLDKPMVVRAGDVLEVKLLYHPELNERQSVRPDGKIALQLVNEVEVAGLAPAQVRQRLLELYAVDLKDPEVTVIVQTDERYVYVGGEVAIPSGQFPIRVPIVDRLTPMEAIMQAGGFRKASAKLSNVLIIRRIGDTQYARTLDLRRAFRTAEGSPFYLAPSDIVFVPRTKIDRADQWVDQYMNRLVPDWVSLNLGYSYSETQAVGTRSTITASPSGVTISRTD